MRIVELGSGACSVFGGPFDATLSLAEGLALIEPQDLSSWWFGSLFLAGRFPDKTGLARRLNPDAFYCAMRWDYRILSRDVLRRSLVLARRSGASCWLRPVDWGPNVKTRRLVDISPGAARALGARTDDSLNLTLFAAD